MTEIRLEKVSKSFGAATVVQPLDLIISEGEFFTFVGPSGCGKSTLLNLVAGLEQPTSGDIVFDGVRVNDVSPRERDVAMVFQSYALYPHMTVFENIAFPLRMKNAPRAVIDSAVKGIASLLDIENLLVRKPKELSGGQRQRVALGRAMVRKPKVFLMDEPLSNLDARLRIEMRAELKLLHLRLGITTIYVTHDQGEAMGLSQRIAVLNRGEIQQCDTPAAVYRRPENMFVAGFIGSPPMNFLQCDVRNKAPLEVACNGLVLTEAGAGQPETDRVTLGIRPEDAKIERDRREEGIEVTVSVLEPAGAFDWAEVVWRGVKFRGVAAAGEDLAPGRKAYLTFPRHRISLFDTATGKKL